MSLNPFTTDFSAAEALSRPLEASLEALPTARDRAIFKKALPVNNLAQCQILSIAPYRVLKPGAVRAEGTKKTVSGDKVKGVLKELHKRAGQGPLGMLLKAVQGRFLIRVVLRERHSINGSLDGFLQAFDKHFNMVLSHTVRGGRRMGQIFVRGENVVLVRLLDKNFAE